MNLGTILNSALGAVHQASGVDVLSSLSSLWNKFTGAGLTGAQQEANQFTADQATLAYQRSLAADSTKYQRTVADMKAAGINPMLAMSNGASGSVVASPASSVQPGESSINLGSILSFVLGMKQMNIQKALASAEIANKNADTQKKQSETEGQDIFNLINSSSAQEQADSWRLRNNLSREQVSLIDKQKDEIAANIRNLNEHSDSEASRRALNDAQAMLARANVYQLAAMLPYQQALAVAQTEAARQAAALSSVSAAYKQGLIDNGYIESFAREMAANAGRAENDETLSDIKTALRTGDYSDVRDYIKPDFTSRFLQSLTVFLDNLNPLNSILK